MMAVSCAKRALLVVDLQNDFVSTDGPFAKSAVDASHIASNLTKALPLFRGNGGVIIWVKSEYSCSTKPRAKFLPRPGGERFQHVPMNDNFLSGTHSKFPLCVSGTEGAQLMSGLQPHEDDIILTKTYYSAFTDTNLDELLKNTDEVHVCGLMSNVCVLATVTDAFFHGHEKIFVWADCLGFRSENRHIDALEKMESLYGAKLIASNPFLEPISRKPILYYVNGSIPNWRVMMALYEKGIDFNKRRLKVMSTPKETRSPQFLAKNPRGKTPTLVDSDGTIIAESLAILHYLETYYSNTMALMPKAVSNKTDYMLTLQRMQESQILVDVYEPLEEVVFKTPTNRQRQHRELLAKTLEAIDHELDYWEANLQKTQFVASGYFTMADCAFYPALAYLIHRGLVLDKQRFPRLCNYVNEIKKRPSATKSHPEGWNPNGGRVNVFEIAKHLITES